MTTITCLLTDGQETSRDVHAGGALVSAANPNGAGSFLPGPTTQAGLCIQEEARTLTFLTKCFPQFTRTNAVQGMRLTIFHHTNGRGKSAPLITSKHRGACSCAVQGRRK